MPDQDALKNALKDALKEWLNEKYGEFGRWSFHAIMASALAALTYYLISHNAFTLGPK